MDTSKLAQRLSRLQERRGGGNNIFFKAPDDGSMAVIRMVPYPHNENNEPFIEVGWHYRVGGFNSLVCPRETFGDPCPICDLAEEIKSMGGKDNWQIFKKLSAKLRYYSPVLVRGKEDEGVKLWGYGTTIYEGLLEKFVDPDWGDLSHPATGRDIKVWTIPKGSKGNDTDFAKPKMDVSPSQTKLLAKKDDIIKLLESVPNVFGDDSKVFATKDYAELKEIVSKMASTEEDEETETSSSNDYFDSGSDDTASESKGSSSVSDELDSLLGDLD